MDRKTLKDHLARAEEQVAFGESQILRQREVVAELLEKGLDSAESTKLLALFQDLQEIHVANAYRLRRALEQPPEEPGC